MANSEGGESDNVETQIKTHEEGNLQAALFQAVYVGNLDIIKKLVSRGVDITSELGFDTMEDCGCAGAFEDPKTFETYSEYYSDPEMNGPLIFIKNGQCECLSGVGFIAAKEHVSWHGVHIAAARGFGKVLAYLLSQGCDVNSRSGGNNLTPLHVTVVQTSNQTEGTVRALLAAGADINAQDKSGFTPLCLASYYECDPMVRILVESGCDLDACIKQGESALNLAVSEGSLEVVQILLDGGASCRASLEDPLLIAMKQDNIDIAKLLLQKGNCDLDYHDQKSTSEPSKGATALHWAVYQENVEMVKMLLDAGADPDARAAKGHTPLIAATYSNLKEMAVSLVEHNADVCLTDYQDYGALHLAAWEGHVELVKLLLERAAPHDLQTSDKNTPLALACHGNHLDVIKQLLPMGCNVNNADKDRDTPMHYLAYNGCDEGVKILLEYGADPNVKNAEQTTPLWNAVYMAHRKTIKVLLEENVDVDVPSVGIDQYAQTDRAVKIYDEPITPTEVACQKGLWVIAQLLILTGASVNFLEEKGYLTESAMEYPDMGNWLMAEATNPPCLRRLCRKFIRALLGRNIKNKVKELNIPVSLQDYVTLKEL